MVALAPHAEKIDVDGCDADVFAWRLDTTAYDLGELYPLLSADEAARAARFHFEAHRGEFIVARTIMRKLLGAHLGAKPGELRFALNAYGKPSVSAPLEFGHFNLTHSGGWAALAISSAPVGIDMEEVRPMGEDVAGRFFSPMENEALSAASTPEARLELFYRIWTCREAVSKADGRGLSLDNSSFEIHFARDSSPLFRPLLAMKTFKLCRLNHIDGFIGAIACQVSPSAL